MLVDMCVSEAQFMQRFIICFKYSHNIISLNLEETFNSRETCYIHP